MEYGIGHHGEPGLIVESLKKRKRNRRGTL